MTVTVSHTQPMLEDAQASIGIDCCEGDHGSWELQDVGFTHRHRHIALWSCAGCGCIYETDVDHDRLNHPILVDPDGTIIEMTRPNRPRRR